MGWHHFVAAVKPNPPVGEVGRAVPAFSPNRDFNSDPWGSLLWTALIAPAGCEQPRHCLEIDPQNHLLKLDIGDSVTLSFTGFDVTATSRRSDDAREEARRSSFDLLRRASTSLDRGSPGQALALIDQALDLLRPNGTPHLLEWSRRRKVQALIAAGQMERAEGLFTELQLEYSGIASQLAFEVAVAHHLAGNLNRARELYELGLGPGALETAAGRPPWESARGLLLVLAELEPKSMIRAIERHSGALVNGRQWLDALREYAHWWNGAAHVAIETRGRAVDHPDLIRYWRLEFLHRRGHSARELLAKLRQEKQRNSEAKSLVAALEAKLLSELGRDLEAHKTIMGALAEIRAGARTDPILRAHLSLVEKRARELEILADP